MLGISFGVIVSDCVSAISVDFNIYCFCFVKTDLLLYSELYVSLDGSAL